MLEKLIGAQVTKVGKDEIDVQLNGKGYTLYLDSDDGDCCGYSGFEIIHFDEENTSDNPIITNVEYEGEDDYDESTSKVTFFGLHKEILKIESSAGSGSGWNYGANVTISCKELDIDNTLAAW